MSSEANLALLIDALDKLGINTDVSGTNTLFARLAQIAGYTENNVGIKSIQKGLSTIPNNELFMNVPISAVDVGKAIPIIVGKKWDFDTYTLDREAYRSDIASVEVRCQLSTPTTLFFDRFGSIGQLWINWFIIEFY